ncbi:hypothetical protein KEM54_005056 [Ascosphaera aggregata]|nr:hypothetical protein KEM54_005056 [Ascosphaera aggregata]
MWRASLWTWPRAETHRLDTGRLISQTATASQVAANSQAHENRSALRATPLTEYLAANQASRSFCLVDMCGIRGLLQPVALITRIYHAWAAESTRPRFRGPLTCKIYGTHGADLSYSRCRGIGVCLTALSTKKGHNAGTNEQSFVGGTQHQSQPSPQYAHALGAAKTSFEGWKTYDSVLNFIAGTEIRCDKAWTLQLLSP